MGNIYEINLGDNKRIVTVTETTSREIEISGKTYIVPVGIVKFIEEMASEIQTQQSRRVATDKELDSRIGKRIDRMLRSLSDMGLLSDSLDAAFPLPPNIEVDGGVWTFMDEARMAAREGLRNEYQDDLVTDIGNQFEKVRRRL